MRNACYQYTSGLSFCWSTGHKTSSYLLSLSFCYHQWKGKGGNWCEQVIFPCRCCGYKMGNCAVGQMEIMFRWCWTTAAAHVRLKVATLSQSLLWLFQVPASVCMDGTTGLPRSRLTNWTTDWCRCQPKFASHVPSVFFVIPFVIFSVTEVPLSSVHKLEHPATERPQLSKVPFSCNVITLLWHKMMCGRNSSFSELCEWMTGWFTQIWPS